MMLQDMRTRTPILQSLKIFVIPFMQVAQSTQCESVETAGIFVESPSFFIM